MPPPVCPDWTWISGRWCRDNQSSLKSQTITAGTPMGDTSTHKHSGIVHWQDTDVNQPHFGIGKDFRSRQSRKLSAIQSDFYQECSAEPRPVAEPVDAVSRAATVQSGREFRDTGHCASCLMAICPSPIIGSPPDAAPGIAVTPYGMPLGSPGALSTAGAQDPRRLARACDGGILRVVLLEPDGPDAHTPHH